jgi:MscS family membrane protein
MKNIIIVLLLTSFSAFAQNSTPREVMQTYLKSMVNIKTGEGIELDNYKTAISTLDLRHIEQSLKFDLGKRYSVELIKAIDKIKKVDYKKIPAETKLTKWYFYKSLFQSNVLEISLVKVDNAWFFSKETLDSLKGFKQQLRNKKNVTGVSQLETLQDKVKANLPEIFSQKIFLLDNWQWIGLVILFIFGLIIETVFKFILTNLLNKNIAIIKNNDTEKLQGAVKPLGKIIFVATLMNLIFLLDFDSESLSFVKRALYIVMSCMSVWFAHKVIDLVSFYSLEMAKKTKTKFDDILIPLLTKTAYVIAYLFGIVLIANSLTVDVSSIVAGLGIGGLAFAFAAKDTLSNFFGSIMLVLDRPFDIGDVITAGDVEGVVSEVGFRSTRIRTFQDSIITISNGELMNRSINNLGKRRYRRLSTNLGLEYDTPPEKIEEFCEGIRQLILNYKWTRKDYFNVYFTNFGASSLDIQVMVFWETSDYTREQAEKHRLNIDILRLANDMSIGFAFPTQTVHMFNETKIVSEKEAQADTKYFSKGMENAKKLLEKPLSLKNPRSNANDKEQFGDNDIGFK